MRLPRAWCSVLLRSWRGAGRQARIRQAASTCDAASARIERGQRKIGQSGSDGNVPMTRTRSGAMRDAETQARSSIWQRLCSIAARGGSDDVLRAALMTKGSLAASSIDRTARQRGIARCPHRGQLASCKQAPSLFAEPTSGKYPPAGTSHQRRTPGARSSRWQAMMQRPRQSRR